MSMSGASVRSSLRKRSNRRLEPDGIHRRDAEAVADGGVGGRAAPLAEDPLAPREAHDVPHDEEVAGEPELADERELVRDLPLVRVGAPRRARLPPSLACALLDEAREVLVGAHAGRQRERRGGVGLSSSRRNAQRSAMASVARTPSRLPRQRRAICARALEVPLAVGAEPRAHLVERPLVPQRRRARRAPRGRGRARSARRWSPPTARRARGRRRSARAVVARSSGRPWSQHSMATRRSKMSMQRGRGLAAPRPCRRARRARPPSRADSR